MVSITLVQISQIPRCQTGQVPILFYSRHENGKKKSPPLEAYIVINNSHIVNKPMILQLYIRSIISYVDPTWDLLISKTNGFRIEMIQSIVLRTIFKPQYYVSNHTFLALARLPSIREFILKPSKTLYYKCSHSKYPHLPNIERSETSPLTTSIPRLIDWTLK